MFAAFYPDRYPTNDYDKPFKQTESQTAALSYARTKYMNFDSMGFQIDPLQWQRDSWKV